MYLFFFKIFQYTYRFFFVINVLEFKINIQLIINN